MGSAERFAASCHRTHGCSQGIWKSDCKHVLVSRRAGKLPVMRKILLPIGDASEVLDTMYPFYRLPEDGFEVVVAGPEARTYHLVIHEIPPREGSSAVPWDVTREQPGYHLRASAAFYGQIPPITFHAERTSASSVQARAGRAPRVVSAR